MDEVTIVTKQDRTVSQRTSLGKSVDKSASIVHPLVNPLSFTFHVPFSCQDLEGKKKIEGHYSSTQQSLLTSKINPSEIPFYSRILVSTSIRNVSPICQMMFHSCFSVSHIPHDLLSYFPSLADILFSLWR